MIKIKIKKELHGVSSNMYLDVDISIKQGEFLCLSGKSGSGKTTFLRVLAGLEEAKAEIIVNNQIWQNENTFLKVQKREVGFVFQDYALFTNMTLEENLLFVQNDKVLCKKLLDMTELTSLKKRYPNKLSGGQKQRVALARALMKKPKLLLLDEPLSALDMQIREKLQNDILNLHQEFNTTTIMVSHEPSEIYKLSSQIIILDNGKIKEQGNAKDILLKTQGSQKFSFNGKLLDIKKVDVIYIAIIAVSQQLVEVVISKEEAQKLKIGKNIKVGTKAFSPIISQEND